MYFLIEDDDLLEIGNTIWDIINADIKKEFDSKLVYNKNYLKTKIKCNGDEVTYFYDKKIPTLYSDHTCLELFCILLSRKMTVINCKCFLKECKYIEKKVVGHIHDSLSDFSYSSDKSEEEWIRVG